MQEDREERKEMWWWWRVGGCRVRGGGGGGGRPKIRQEMRKENEKKSLPNCDETTQSHTLG